MRDGLFFKDMDNSGQLSPYKDWRLDPETRARDMVAHLRLDQQAGLVLNALMNSPVSMTRREATDENGRINPAKIFKRHDPSEQAPPSPFPGLSMACDDAGVMMAQAMGAAVAGNDDNASLRRKLTALFEARGYTVVDDPDKADVLYLHVWPISNGIVFRQFAMPVIELVDQQLVEEREVNRSQKKTGNLVSVCTLKDVDRMQKLADAAHARGAKVVATCVVSNPWILDKLEPYVDALTIQYTVSPVAMDNALGAQMDVLSGSFNPTGKLSLTMVSCPEVIAITEKEIDGVLREVCASPNDVPGYDKDPYIDPDILAKVPGHSYAYQDGDGNYYRSGFGLHY